MIEPSHRARAHGRRRCDARVVGFAWLVVGMVMLPGRCLHAQQAVAPKVLARPPARVRVPRVIGLRTDSAARLLQGAKLQLRIAGTTPSPQTAGTIVEQTPLPDSLAIQGTAVRVRLASSSAPPGVADLVPVPELVGQSLDSAAVRIAQAQLAVGEVTRRRSAQPLGMVLDQRPKPKTLVASGTRVFLTVAEGVKVPRLLGLGIARADSALKAAGLALGGTSRRLTFKTGGAVLGQTPRAGSIVPLNTSVSLVISRHVPLGGIGAGAVVLAVLLGGAYLIIRTPPGGANGADPAPAPDPGVRVVLHSDPGTQRFERGTPPEIETALRIRAVWDPGVQHIGARPSLVEDDRNA